MATLEHLLADIEVLRPDLSHLVVDINEGLSVASIDADSPEGLLGLSDAHVLLREIGTSALKGALGAPMLNLCPIILEHVSRLRLRTTVLRAKLQRANLASSWAVPAAPAPPAGGEADIPWPLREAMAADEGEGVDWDALTRASFYSRLRCMLTGDETPPADMEHLLQEVAPSEGQTAWVASRFYHGHGVTPEATAQGVTTLRSALWASPGAVEGLWLLLAGRTGVQARTIELPWTALLAAWWHFPNMSVPWPNDLGPLVREALAELRQPVWPTSASTAVEVRLGAPSPEGHAGVAQRYLMALFQVRNNAAIGDNEANGEQQVSVGAQLLATCITAGVDPVFAEEAVARALVRLQLTVEGPRHALGTSFKHTIANAYIGAAEAVAPVASSWAEFMFWLDGWLQEHLLDIGLFDWLVALTGRIATQVQEYALMLLSGILLALEKITDNHKVLVSAVAEVVVRSLDVLIPNHRSRPKSVWAMIFRSAGMASTPAEVMLSSLPEMTWDEPGSYEEWATRMNDLLSEPALGDLVRLPATTPQRQTFLPRDTYGHRCLEQYMTELEGKLVETTRERDRLDRLIQNGARQGIDAAWMASPERVQASLARYETPVAAIPTEDKVLFEQAADALVDRFPSMYTHARPMTVGNVMQAIKWKYSAGLPFIHAVKKRESLLQAPWFARVRRAAEKILSSGKHPGVAFHGFPKADVIPLQNALKTLGLRTVVAQDLVTSIVSDVIMLERNKRPPAPDAFVVNKMSRTEGGLRDLFDALRKRDTIILGDGKAFDSTVPRDLAMSGSVRMWERGYEHSINAKAAKTIAAAYYAGITRGIIVNLTSGETVVKAGGGGTGSAHTGNDNNNWVDLVFVGSFARVTGRPASDFWQVFTFGHAADDVALSCRRQDLPLLEAMVQYARDVWGVTFAMDVGSLEVDGFLHTHIIPVSEESEALYKKLGFPVPTYAIQNSQDRILMKRTAYRSDKAPVSGVRAVQYLVERGIGHLQLTAHNPDLYDWLAREAMEDVTSYLQTWYQHVEWDTDLDRDGRVVAARVSGLTDLQPRVVRRYQRRGGLERAEKALQSTLSRWLRAHRLPSYKAVFKAWVQEPRSKTEGSALAARYRRVDLLAEASNPFTEAVKLHLLSLRRLLRGSNRMFKHAQVDLVLNPPLIRWPSSSYHLETFAWTMLYKRLGREPTGQEFLAEVRLSPFTSATDPVGFIWRLRSHDGAYQAKLVAQAANDMDLVVGTMWWYTLFYWASDRLVYMGARTPLVGIIVQLFLLLSEMAGLYALLNYIYYMGTGTSSVEVSNLIPRDPFAVQKQIAAAMVAMLPAPLRRVPAAARISSFFPYVVDSFVRWNALRLAPATTIQKAALTVRRPWIVVADDAARHFAHPGASSFPRTVTAPTGSGKSTEFVAALVTKARWSRIWVLMPTVLAVSEYRNPFLEDRLCCKVDRDHPPLSSALVCVCTYGHFLAAWLEKVRGSGNLILMDEVHTRTSEIDIVYCLTDDTTRIGITATMTTTMFQSASGYDATIPSAAPHSVAVVREDFASLIEGVERAEAYGFDMSRPLLVHPTEATCEDVARAMQAGGRQASVLSRKHLEPASAGAIVATTIVDVAVTISPGPTSLIDEGWAHSVQPLTSPTPERVVTHTIVASSPATARQRLGRVGRVADARALVHSRAGTGPELPPTVSVLPLLMRPNVWSQAKVMARLSILVQHDYLAHPLEWIHWDHSVAGCTQESAWGLNFLLAFLLCCSNITWDDALDRIAEGHRRGRPFDDVRECALLITRSLFIEVPRINVATLRGAAHRPPTFVRFRGEPVYTWTVGVRYYRLLDSTVSVVGPSTLALNDDVVIAGL